MGKLAERLRSLVRSLICKGSRGVYYDKVPSPPRKQMLSHQWLSACRPFARNGAKLLSVDPPYKVEFPEQTPFSPHPTLCEHRWPRNVVDVPGTYVLEIPYGRTIGARGTVLTNDNVLISDLSMQEDLTAAEHFLIKKPQETPSKLRRLKGTYALLSCFGTTTYHWIYDCLPRFEVLRRAGYDREAFDGFLIRRPKYQPHYKALELLGIPEDKIVWCTKSSHYGCDRLVVPSFTTDHLVDDQKDHHPWVFPFLQNLAGISLESAGKKRRILLNRKDSLSTARQFSNQAEFAALLEKYGFEEVTLGEFDFLGQARLFASAEFIVAAHGGGLSNLCFCAPSTKVLELFAPDYVRVHFRNIARQLGLRYEPLVMECVSNSREPMFGGNIRVDLLQAEEIVRTMLI